MRFPVRSAALVLSAALLPAASALADGEKEGSPREPKKDPPKDAKADPAADAAAEKEKRQAQERAAQEQFSKADRNSDSTLRGDEIPAGWLDRFDRDGDGDVGRSEFSEVMSRPARLRKLHPMRDLKARTAEILRGFDQDKDGKVSREEFPGDDHVFRGADRNRDGFLQGPEVVRLADEQLEDVRKQMKNPSRNEFLTLFDLDRNNRVDPDEYDGPPAALRRWDADGDGVVTYDELYPERMAARRGAAAAPPPKQEDENAIRKLDKDGDGKVARDEFPGSDAAWRRIDLNGDGWVTIADAR